MRSLWALFPICFLCTTLASAEDKPKKSTLMVQQLEAVTQQRASAFAAGNCKIWNGYVGKEFQNIESKGPSTRSEQLRECEDQTRQLCKQKRHLSDYHFQYLGTLVVVDYQVEVTDKCDSVNFRTRFRKTDLFERQVDKWIVLNSAEALILPSPQPLKMDVSALREFSGKYEWEGSRLMDEVSIAGDKLYLRTDNDPPVELVPMGPETFFIPGTLDRVRFLRSADGKISAKNHYSAADGEGYESRKISKP